MVHYVKGVSKIRHRLRQKKHLGKVLFVEQSKLSFDD